MTYCSKPRCASPGSVVLGYDYAARIVILDNAGEDSVSPHLYVLCAGCADSLVPPRGWELIDRRVVLLDRWMSEVAGMRAAGEHAGPGPMQVA